MSANSRDSLVEVRRIPDRKIRVHTENLVAPLELEGQTASPELAGKWICPMHWEVVATAAGQHAHPLRDAQAWVAALPRRQT